MFTEKEQNSAVPAGRLWFGFATSIATWVTLGCLDILVTWLSCTHQEDFGVPHAQPAAKVLFGIFTVLLMALTLTAGFTSYRNWRTLSSQPRLLESSAIDRREFMALLGVIISVTLGMGIIWLALPPLFLDLCWRAR